MSKEELITNKIFIDTSVFIQENFFKGSKLNAFYKHAKEGEIELFITVITINEVLANVEKKFEQANQVFKSTIKELDTKAKVLKNIEGFNYIFGLNDAFDASKELKNLKKKMHRTLNENFKVIEIDISKTMKIFDDYFQEKSPFKAGQKKEEFPDAFVLNSLETWCLKNKEKIYILSTDPDILNYPSQKIIPIKEYDKLLNQISYTYSADNKIVKVEEVLDKCNKEIVDAIREEFEDSFPSEGWDDSYGYEYQLNGFESIELEPMGHSILSIFNNEASIELSYRVFYNAEIGYEDLSTAFYDKEDGIYYGTEQLTQIISGIADIDVDLKITIDLPGKAVVWEWELLGISKGLPDNISLD